MTLATYEPPNLEVVLTLGLGLTVLSPYYRRFVRDLNLRGDERVLDYGSGAGILSRHIAARLRRGGGRLDCVDISHGWRQIIQRTLRRYNNVNYHLGPITQLSLPDNAYDVVVIHFVLHEISPAQRPAVVKALTHRLKPGGRIVLREPQGEGLTSADLRRLASEAGLHPTTLEATKSTAGAIYNATLQKHVGEKGNQQGIQGRDIDF